MYGREYIEERHEWCELTWFCRRCGAPLQEVVDRLRACAEGDNVRSVVPETARRNLATMLERTGVSEGA